MRRNPLLMLSNFRNAGNAGTNELIARCQPGYFFLPSLSVLLIFLSIQAQIQSEADSRNKAGPQPQPYFLSQLNGVVSLILLLLIILILIRLDFIGHRATRPHVYKQSSPPITQQKTGHPEWRRTAKHLVIILLLLLILLIRRSCAAPKSRYSSKPNIFQF